jgi:hypothetical protein
VGAAAATLAKRKHYQQVLLTNVARLEPLLVQALELLAALRTELAANRRALRVLEPDYRRQRT